MAAAAKRFLLDAILARFARGVPNLLLFLEALERLCRLLAHGLLLRNIGRTLTRIMHGLVSNASLQRVPFDLRSTVSSPWSGIGFKCSLFNFSSWTATKNLR